LEGPNDVKDEVLEEQGFDYEKAAELKRSKSRKKGRRIVIESNTPTHSNSASRIGGALPY